MSKKEDWIQRIEKFKSNELSIKELSGCTDGILTYRKIYKDLKKTDKKGNPLYLSHLQLGPEDSGCAIVMEKKDAINYIRCFYDSNEDLTPPTKMLFPELLKGKRGTGSASSLQ